MFDNLRKDYARHGGSLLSLSFWTMATFRFGRWSFARRTWIGRKITSMVYTVLALFIEMATGNTIDRTLVVGTGFHLIHSGNIRIHPNCVIGDRCGIMHDVTIGMDMDGKSSPILGDDVFIGAGAKVLGDVRIGDGARVAANSLVLVDVPPGATAIGVPARVLRYTGRAANKSDDERS
jgi:serine O-acetyltransferase